jgi:PAS domain S-box-containing protein
MVGHDESTLLGSHVSVVMDPEEITRTEDVIRSLLSSGEDRETVEMAILTAEGERIPCEAHITVLPFEGTFRGTVGVVRDVSERLEHVRKLEALQRRTQALMHTRTLGETGRLAVETAEEVLGVPLCGVHLLDDDDRGDALVPVTTVDRVRETFDEPPTYRRDSGAETDRVVWEVFEAGEPLAIEDTRERGDLAAETPARSALLHPLADHGVLVLSSTEPGAFDGTDRVLVEILATALTAALDRVEREAQLERQNDRLEEFASVVSHDLRNPLNVAMGSLDLAREACELPELDAVANAHERMDMLIDDLLELAREGETAVETEPVALAGAVERCWRNVETGGATLRVETDRVVLADESLLGQFLKNLVGNAVEHGSTSPPSQAREDSAEHGSTSSRTQSGDSVEHGSSDDRAPPEEDGVTVTIGDAEDGFYVEDDGPGIPEDERERVFEAGYSASDDGTGLGLKIAADAARRQGWEVAATEGSDGGARFEVTGVEFDRE